MGGVKVCLHNLKAMIKSVISVWLAWYKKGTEVRTYA